jgi:hypothetical protein
VLATAYLYHGDPTLGSDDGGLGMMTIEGAFQSSDLLSQALEFVRGQHTTNDATCGVRMHRGPSLSTQRTTLTCTGARCSTRSIVAASPPILSPCVAYTLRS